jgi:hypothetical protein
MRIQDASGGYLDASGAQPFHHWGTGIQT